MGLTRTMNGKVVVVTGATLGIGRATALMLAEERADIVLIARNAERLHALRDEIGAMDVSVEAYSVDVTDAEALDAAITRVAESKGRLDGLVNNASSYTYGPVADASNEQWREAFRGGAEAVFVGTRAAMRIMARQGSGSIVNISSTNGLRAMPGMATYSASKAAIIHLSAVAAMEGAPSGVRVNAIAPGLVETPHAAEFFDTDPALKLSAESKIPMLRAARAEEIAAPILFLLSDAAAYITGTCLNVDGGKAVQLFA